MPPDEVRFIASPTHTVAPPAVAVGKALTVTVVLATAVQLLAFVTVTVYTPPFALVALFIFNGLADDVPPPLGNVQLYALPPEAVKVVLSPAQMVFVPLMAAVGKALILTVVVVVATLHSSAAPSGSSVVIVMVTLPHEVFSKRLLETHNAFAWVVVGDNGKRNVTHASHGFVDVAFFEYREHGAFLRKFCGQCLERFAEFENAVA